MLMIVPLMIWSTRNVIASQACSSDTAMPARIAASSPTAAAPMTQPTKAVVSMIPSRPILTTPERSHRTPQSAANAIGTATATVVCDMKLLFATTSVSYTHLRAHETVLDL